MISRGFCVNHQITGTAVTTCGTRRRTSPTLTEMGAPVKPINDDDPGGMTIRSAPTPSWLSFDPFTKPEKSATTSRIMVTSSAIAHIVINDRVGRCTRLATTILFIIGKLSAHSVQTLDVPHEC